MSDIPIGSPPAPPGRHAAPQGWYADPVDSSRERYWDGWSWTRNTRPAPAAGAGQQAGRPGPGTAATAPQQTQPYGQQPYASQPGGTHGQAGPAGPRTPDGVPLAGWGWRFLAGILDLILVGLIGLIAGSYFYLKSIPVITDYLNESIDAQQRGQTPPVLEPTDLMSGGDQLTIALISGAVGVVYFALFWRLKSATPAQLLCGLRVVPFERGRNTDPLGWAQVITRAVLWSVPFTVGTLLLIFGLINALSPLWNRNRQAFHDRAAGTQLVKIR